MSKVDYDNIGIENDGDIIFITVSKYKLFMSYGKTGIDAMVLYFHLMFTARLQATNKVWASNSYVRQGLKWSKERLLKAKNLLSDLDLISQEQSKDETGKFQKTYITVKTRTTMLEFDNDITGGLKNGQRDTRLPGNDHKCFNEKGKCLNEKENYIDILNFWNDMPSLQTHKELTFERKWLKKHSVIIDEYGVEEVKQAIKNYSEVYLSSGHYFDHRYNLFRFIEKGVDQFIDDASPLSNFKKTVFETKTKDQLQREEIDRITSEIR